MGDMPVSLSMYEVNDGARMFMEKMKSCFIISLFLVAIQFLKHFPLRKIIFLL